MMDLPPFEAMMHREAIDLTIIVVMMHREAKDLTIIVVMMHRETIDLTIIVVMDPKICVAMMDLLPLEAMMHRETIIVVMAPKICVAMMAQPPFVAMKHGKTIDQKNCVGITIVGAPQICDVVMTIIVVRGPLGMMCPAIIAIIGDPRPFIFAHLLP